MNLIKSKYTLLLFSIFFALIVGEYILAPILFKLTDKPSRALMLLGLHAPANTQIDDTPINAQGFTGDVINKLKPDQNTIRILTLGGSAMFNRRMTERLTASFKKALSNTASAKIEILGGALRGHCTRYSVIKYSRYFYKYNFDYVIIYHGINDLWMNHVASTDFRDDYSHLNAWSKRNWLMDHSILARNFYNEYLWHKRKKVNNGAKSSSYRTFNANIRELVRVIRKNNGVPVLMSYAWYIPENYTITKFLQGKLDYINPTNYDRCMVEHWGDLDYVKEGLKRHNLIIKTISKEKNILLIDQKSKFEKKAVYFGEMSPCTTIFATFSFDDG